MQHKTNTCETVASLIDVRDRVQGIYGIFTKECVYQTYLCSLSKNGMIYTVHRNDIEYYILYTAMIWYAHEFSKKEAPKLNQNMWG